MEDASHEEDQGLSRRGLLRKGLVVGLGAAGLSVATSALTAGTALADTGTATHGGTTVTFSLQYGWRCCGLCFNLYFLANGGTCWGIFGPGGTHNAPHEPYTGDTDYGVPIGVASTTSIQSPWRYCVACASLYYGPDQSSSFCTTNRGPHSTGSTIYYLPYASWSGTGLQSGWRFCAHCKVLFWGGQIANSDCVSTDGPHATIGPVASATNYNLFMK